MTRSASEKLSCGASRSSICFHTCAALMLLFFMVFIQCVKCSEASLRAEATERPVGVRRLAAAFPSSTISCHGSKGWVKGKSGTRQKSGSKLPHSKSPQEDASGTRRSFVPQKRKSPDRSSRPCRDRFGAIEPTYKKKRPRRSRDALFNSDKSTRM